MFWFQLTKLVFVCKAHYYNCILNELGINSTFGNHTYTPTALSKDELLQNHASVLNTFNIPANGMDEYELPYQYWIPKLHKNPNEQRLVNVPPRPCLYSSRKY